MGRRGKNLDPEKEFKNFVHSMEEFLHKGQYPSLTILMEGILNYLMQKEREFYLQKNPYNQLWPTSSKDSQGKDIKYFQTSLTASKMETLQ